MTCLDRAIGVQNRQHRLRRILGPVGAETHYVPISLIAGWNFPWCTAAGIFTETPS